MIPKKSVTGNLTAIWFSRFALFFFFITVQEHRLKPSEARSVLKRVAPESAEQKVYFFSKNGPSLRGFWAVFLDSYKKNYIWPNVENWIADRSSDLIFFERKGLPRLIGHIPRLRGGLERFKRLEAIFRPQKRWNLVTGQGPIFLSCSQNLKWFQATV